MVAVSEAPEGMCVTIAEPKRNLDQNARLHALLADIVKSGKQWMGQVMGLDDWKALFVHALDTVNGEAGRAVPGLEGGIVLLRRSTAKMSKRDLSELIEYIEMQMTKWEIPVRDSRHAA
jgi:hypothetical protein